jgi:GH15 family glucan-1,4-alpha-glucosidase
MNWLEARCHDRDADGSLQIVYGIDGRKGLPESTLDHLDGYRGSAPVRVGNAAADQLQLDIYGELMDAVYLANKYHAPIAFDFWQQLRQLVDWVCDHWQEPDEGIWEVRGGQKQFVYSKLMCWVALDRALRLAHKRSFPADRARWLACRDAIYEEVMQRGWSADREAFVQHYDSDALDASTLIMPLVFFMAPNDPRMTKTLDATLQPPEAGGLVSDSLVYRYDQERVDDGLPGGEGTFNMCTFWMVEALTRAGRTDPACLDRARLMFEKMLGYANHVGLYAEETGRRGQALGNLPQAFTHLALISAAYNLDRTLDGQRYGLVG